MRISLFTGVIAFASGSSENPLVDVYNILSSNSEYRAKASEEMISDSQLFSHVSNFVSVPPEVRAVLVPRTTHEEPETKEGENPGSSSATVASSDVAVDNSESEYEESSKTFAKAVSLPKLKASSGLQTLASHVGELNAMILMAKQPSDFQVPVYEAFVLTELKALLDDSPAKELFCTLMKQLHFRSLFADDDFEKFKVVGSFLTQTMIDMMSGVVMIKNDAPVDEVVAFEIRGYDVPPEVTKGFIDLGLECLLACMVSLRGSTTTTTTTSPTPTLNPAEEALRMDELKQYVKMVNLEIDSLNDLIDVVQAAHEADPNSREVKRALSQLRSASLETYASLYGAALLNAYLKVDVEVSKKMFFKLADIAGNGFDGTRDDEFIAALKDNATGVRTILLAVAKQ
jgi:hypothetical protein